jgi:hypothetical protein
VGISSSIDPNEDSRERANVPAGNKAELKRSSVSQIRSRLKTKVAKDIQNFPQGDIVLYVNLPATRQGKMEVVHSPMPPQQVLAALTGIQKELPRPDPLLEAHIKKLQTALAVLRGISHAVVSDGMIGQCWTAVPMTMAYHVCGH